MKQIKNKLLLTMVVLGATITTQSQAQTFSVKGGVNLANMEVSDDGSALGTPKMYTGYHVGITRDFKITDAFVFETGLLYSTKGYKIDYSESYDLPFFGTIDVSSKGHVALSYIEIPLLAKGYYDVGDLRLYGALGPYVGIGIAGKIKTESTSMGETQTTDEKLKFGSDVQRMDLGVSFGAGAEFKSFILGVNYGLGLSNIEKDNSAGSLKNRVLGISLGYRFGG